MVIISGRDPGFLDEESWAEDFLAEEGPDLDPEPGGHGVEGVGVGFDIEDVVWEGIKVEEGGEAEEGLAGDVFPAQSFAAVAHDVAVNLGRPQGKIDESKGVAVEGAERGGPGRGGQGDKEDGEEEEVEF